MALKALSIFASLSIFMANGGFAFMPKSRANSRGLYMVSGEKISVMVNGMPGPMAVEVAKACLDRGFNIVPVAFTGPNMPNKFTVEGAKASVEVELKAGPGIGSDANSVLKSLKSKYPDMVVIDYTHPSAILNNLACYGENNCDFVMGTTGGEPEKVTEIFNKGKNMAVIAPNMGKQIVAMQAALQEMANRFPGSFGGYKLTVTESHQSTKADTSGTAKVTSMLNSRRQ
jgi:4-hydroxy-tetrahydrodipicolinate reductase